MRLTIIAEVDETKLRWQGQLPKGMTLVEAFNAYYEVNPEDAFELAIQDPNIKIKSARLE